MGQNLLREELNKRPINTAAKNVILFLGDGQLKHQLYCKIRIKDKQLVSGMSIATVTAARIYKGQEAGNSGEEGHLSFEQFPYGALSRVYIIISELVISFAIQYTLEFR